ncbi:AAA family ATPase [Polyangium aurulentum]|uniref:AAA family ATPase n=1 Tax=Polyangium aurulentum TaxID=2567896 RepID=UPI0010ADE5E2|nr:ATP-binding protein [Polyangium aurulentum]UQA60076.1 ATP-binding protein [Polyangium aurulentum]
MITRLEVDGFKSLRDFAVDLEPFTVFIGPNSAGKSNILEALALLSRLASGSITEAFKGGRGRITDQFTRRGGESAKVMRFAVEFLVYGEYPRPEPRNPGEDSFQSRFRYELTVVRQAAQSGVEHLVAMAERLLAMRREEDAWIAAHPEFTDRAGYMHAGQDHYLDLTNPHRTLTHTALSRWSPSLLVELVRDDLRGCRLLQIEPVRMGESSDRTDAEKLAPDASNLPTILAMLPEHLLGEVRADLVSLVPGIASFDVVPEGDSFRIEFELSGGDRLPARLVSDGTLRVLALLTALRTEQRAPILGIEEPENGIYPGRLRALLDLLREESGRRQDDPEILTPLQADIHALGLARIVSNLLPTQILLTTHSPVVLAALHSHSKHLRFVDMVRRNGERVTRVRTVGDVKAPGEGRLHISPREIDMLLHASTSTEEEAE